MNSINKLIMTFSFVLLNTSFVQAQEAEMADAMRANGKIYVVVAIVSAILLGVVVYLFSIDRKVSALEKRLPKNER